MLCIQKFSKSARLFVGLARTVSKWMDTSSNFLTFYSRDVILAFWATQPLQNSNGNPLTENVKYTGMGKICNFRRLSRKRYIRDGIYVGGDDWTGTLHVPAVATVTSIISCCSKLRDGLVLVPAYRSCLETWLLKRLLSSSSLFGFTSDGEITFAEVFQILFQNTASKSI